MSTTTLLDPALAMPAVSPRCEVHFRGTGERCEYPAAWSVAVVCDSCGPRRALLCDDCETIVLFELEQISCQHDGDALEAIAFHRIAS